VVKFKFIYFVGMYAYYKISYITVPIKAYRSNAMFKYDTFCSIFRAAMWPSV